MKNITVVIPIYKDWQSLSKCIESLKKYLDNRHQVILINDMGNEWRKLENKILDSIKGYNNYIYYKNKNNIGFIKSCNRAVFELANPNNDILLLNSDTEVTEGFLNEMNEILNSESRIGVVCPRSNKAAFLSVPIHRNNNVEVTREQSYHIYKEIHPYLPRAEEVWTGVGFAFLVKKEIIDKFGLFDEIYGRGYNEENDFCMRIRQAGYKIMKANHAYVFHDEGKSFSSEKEELELRNSSLLLRRYPDYWDNVKKYEYLVNPIDYFSDLLITDARLYSRHRILICILKELCADEREAIAIYIKNIIGEYKNEFEFQLMVSAKNYKIFKRNFPEVLICTENTLTGTFHMIYSLYELKKENTPLYRKGILIYEKEKDGELVPLLCTLKNLALLNEDNIYRIYGRWNINFNNKNNAFMKNFKIYLYMHHIWIFLWWHKVRKILANKGKSKK